MRFLETPRHRDPAHLSAGAALAGHLRLFSSAPILLCFAFFALQATSFIALQGFMPLSLHQLFQLDMVAATATVTAFMIGSAAGTMAGGVMADRSGRHQRIIVGGLALAAVILFLVGRDRAAHAGAAGGGGPGRRAGGAHHALARHAGARRRPAGRFRQGVRLRLFRARSRRHPDPDRSWAPCSTPAIRGAVFVVVPVVMAASILTATWIPARPREPAPAAS